MIRHIVLFRFKDQAEGRTKEENVAKTRAMLDALPEKIDWIRRTETRVNTDGASPENADLILISDFDSLEDLERYQVHPDHKAVGAFMRPLRESRAAIDFTL